MYQVAKNLHGAEKILMAMGYRLPSDPSIQDSQELRIEGEVDLDHIARTAADLVILQCDLDLLRGNAKALAEYPNLSVKIADILDARSVEDQTYTHTYDEAIARAAGSSKKVAVVHRQDVRPYALNFSSNKHPPASSSRYNNIVGDHFNVHGEETRVHSDPYVLEEQRSEYENILSRRSSEPLLDKTSDHGRFLDNAHHHHPLSNRQQQHTPTINEGGLIGRGESQVIPIPVGTAEVDGRDSFLCSLNTPTTDEMNSMLTSYSQQFTPRPDPNDLPEPVFADEAAFATESAYHHRHDHPPFHRSLSDRPCFENRVGLFVDSRSAYNDHDSLLNIKTFSPDENKQGKSLGRTSGSVSPIAEITEAELCLDDQPRSNGLREALDTGVYSKLDFGRSPRHAGRVGGSPGRPGKELNPSPRHAGHAGGSPGRPGKESNLSPAPQHAGHAGGSPGWPGKELNLLNPPPSATRISRSDNHLQLENTGVRYPDGDGYSRAIGTDTRKSKTSPLSSLEEKLEKTCSGGLLKDPSEEEMGRGRYVASDTPVDGFTIVTQTFNAPEESLGGQSFRRERAEHISEKTRTDYRLKKAGSVQMEHSTHDANLDRSLSESNLDFNASRTSTTWICDYCTFINETEDPVCEVCGIPSKRNPK